MMRSRGFGYRSRPVSRRGVLVGVLAVLAGAGGGVATGMLRPLHPHHSDKPAPPELVDALATELALLARLEAKSGANPALQGVYAALHADHDAHATALRAALLHYAPQPEPVAPVVRSSPARQVQRAAEAAAATNAAKRAARLPGAHAALLASIAACEATHAEVLR